MCEGIRSGQEKLLHQVSYQSDWHRAVADKGQQIPLQISAPGAGQLFLGCGQVGSRLHRRRARQDLSDGIRTVDRPKLRLPRSVDVHPATPTGRAIVVEPSGGRSSCRQRCQLICQRFHGRIVGFDPSTCHSPFFRRYRQAAMGHQGDLRLFQTTIIVRRVVREWDWCGGAEFLLGSRGSCAAGALEYHGKPSEERLLEPRDHSEGAVGRTSGNRDWQTSRKEPHVCPQWHAWGRLRS